MILSLSEPIHRYYEKHEQDDPFSVIEFNYGLKALLDFVETERRGGEKGYTVNGKAVYSLHLSDVAALLDQTERFGIKIDIEIPVERPNAVTLTTAHSSKGLEFDAVYLVDADQNTWHNAGERGKTLLCRNMLFSNRGDANDVRRLLFVAITRARSLLEVSFGKSETIGELLEELKTIPVQPDVSDILDQSKHCWIDSYYPSSAEMKDLLSSYLSTIKMSASLLNSFVRYDADDPKKTSFVLDRLLKLPGLPDFNREFGTLVHAFMENYVARVIQDKNTTVECLPEDFRLKIKAFDFDELEKEHMRQRFDLIVEKFLPKLTELIGPDVSMEVAVERWLNATVGGIPLTGKCDLLVFDTEKKTICIYDYKTGIPKDLSLDNHRQLQFYKLLIKHSPEYDGLTVLGGADLFVEPVKKNNYEIAETSLVPVPDEELEHLSLLIQAVWHRIQSGLFETSGFETSSQMEEVRAASVYKNDSVYGKKGEPKPPGKEDLQAAFEQWLIAEYLKSIQ